MDGESDPDDSSLGQRDGTVCGAEDCELVYLLLCGSRRPRPPTLETGM